MSEKKREDRYIQFPLCLLMQTYQNPANGLNLITGFGIVNYAMKFKYDIVEVGRQLMYAYYRETDNMQRDLKKAIDKYGASGQLTIDEDYNGFSGLKHGTTFNPLEASEELLGLFESDEKFKEDAILLYQIRQATGEKFLNLKVYSIDSTIAQYKKALALKTNFEQKFGADVMPSIKPLQLIEFRDSGAELDVFRAYIGIKSLIGRNTFATANKPVILSRMIGCKSKAAFEHYTTDRYNKDKTLLPTVDKYSKKYHIDKLLLTLAQRKYIMFLSKAKVSVIYLSKYMEPEDLGKLIRETKDRQNLKKRIRDSTASL
ncbi:MAG: hypothetical protein Q8S54_08095 [Bacteroidota bacterium]|nr:hypothetical protein [Bacteroidota bacterium]